LLTCIFLLSSSITKARIVQLKDNTTLKTISKIDIYENLLADIPKDFEV
jgi:hypothetical protein